MSGFNCVSRCWLICDFGRSIFLVVKRICRCRLFKCISSLFVSISVSTLAFVRYSVVGVFSSFRSIISIWLSSSFCCSFRAISSSRIWRL